VLNNALELLGRGWVGTIIGIAGILIAFVLYAISKVRPKLVWQTRGWQLNGGTHPTLGTDLEVRFRGQVVPRVSLCQAVVWNAGTATLRGSDIVAEDPVRLELPEGERILQVTVFRPTRKVNAFAARAEGNAVILAFDFLDPKDGAFINVLHTSERLVPNGLGTVRGMPSGFTFWGEWVEPGQREWRWAALSGGGLTLGAFVMSAFVHGWRGALVVIGGFTAFLTVASTKAWWRGHPLALADPKQKKRKGGGATSTAAP
jgi:hypothetical protein